MDEIQKKFDEVSKKYDGQGRKFIPCFDDFYGITLSAAISDIENPNILDIGAGTGLLSSFLIKKYPKATFTLIDLSEKMMDMAKERFINYPNVKYIIGDYTKYTFSEKYDIVASALSIHHLEDESKKELYKKIYSILHKNGVFINADQVNGETPFIESFNKTIWIQSIEKSGLSIEDRNAGYERMKLDKEAKLNDQLTWLNDIGFTDVSCIYKYYKFAVMFGRKSRE